MLRYAGYAIVYAILLGAVACTIRGERRQARRGDRLDSMIDVVAEREQEPCNHAWPPAPKPATGHVWRITAGQQRCGCVLTTTPDGVRIDTCPAHDPAFVSEWEQRYAQ